jgi:hypothetical protein
MFMKEIISLNVTLDVSDFSASSLPFEIGFMFL